LPSVESLPRTLKSRPSRTTCSLGPSTNRKAYAQSRVLAAGSTQADDIEIYYTSSSSTSSAEPMVMFSLDWRPNLGSTAFGGTECDFLKTGLESNGEPFLPAPASYPHFHPFRARFAQGPGPPPGGSPLVAPASP